MKTIKITFADNDYLITRINGTIDEVITYYRENNFFAWCATNPESKQIKEIEFLEGFEIEKLAGCKQVNQSYVFFDYKNNGLLQ